MAQLLIETDDNPADDLPIISRLFTLGVADIGIDEGRDDKVLTISGFLGDTPNVDLNKAETKAFITELAELYLQMKD